VADVDAHLGAVDGLRGRRRLNDLTAARWFETYRMTSEAPHLPKLPAALTERLAEVLRGEEAQAALHELLAARLTDASDADATAARQVLTLTLTTADAGAAASTSRSRIENLIRRAAGSIRPGGRFGLRGFLFLAPA